MIHLAIIPDGNRRWARKNGKSLEEGHLVGINKLKDICYWVKDLGVKVLSLWIFSSENATRSQNEVNYLMKLFRDKIMNIDKEKLTEDVKVRFAGDKSILSKDIVKRIEEIEKKTKDNKKLQLIILFGYGGRKEIVDAVNKIIKDVKNGEIDKVDEEAFRRYLYIPDIPDPDLIIRTSGEKRLSGIYPWQSTYSEIYFCPRLWPEFEKKDLIRVMEEYKNRERRFGR